ncbi:hypothetical protein [Acinetobacter modestus]|uniref:hypothetical protein n=1 Tax=Acinetobacter modestus TaxID=1776740 RepID=UPI00320846C4
MTNLPNLPLDNNTNFAVGDEAQNNLHSPQSTAILDMGDVTNISKHVSPLCRVINKTYMTDVIDHLVRAHKAQQEIS